MRPYVLVFQHAAEEGLDKMRTVLASRDVAERTVRLHLGGELPTSLGDAAALIVLDARSCQHALESSRWLAPERLLVQRALREELPVLGVGFGATLLAQVLGARLRCVSPSSKLGWTQVSLAAGAAEDPLFRNSPTQFWTLQRTSDVYDLPKAAKSLAVFEGELQAAFHWGNVYGISFHLEKNEGWGARALDAWVSLALGET